MLFVRYINICSIYSCSKFLRILVTAVHFTGRNWISKLLYSITASLLSSYRLLLFSCRYYCIPFYLLNVIGHYFLSIIPLIWLFHLFYSLLYQCLFDLFFNCLKTNINGYQWWYQTILRDICSLQMMIIMFMIKILVLVFDKDNDDDDHDDYDVELFCCVVNRKNNWSLVYQWEAWTGVSASLDCDTWREVKSGLLAI